jgi:hypothetical protein
MPNIHNLGNSQENFINHTGKFSSFLTDTRNINIDREHKSWLFLERLGGDRKGVRLATKEKRPQYPAGSDWPNFKEYRRIEELVRKYGEHGERTGTRRGRLYFEVWDVDITHSAQRLPAWLQKQIRTNFELVAKIYRFSYVKTQHGYQVYLLLEELSPNYEIFHRDSWKGIKRNAGSILSKGRQVQGISSKFKEWVNNGSWFWKLKNVEELATILKKFFFEVGLGQEKVKVDQISSLNIKLNEVNYQSPKVKEISSKIPYKFLKLENIKITSKQATKRANHYRVNYLDKYQNSGFFFMDSYFRDKKDLVQPNLVGDFLLARGYKYQFFLKTY